MKKKKKKKKKKGKMRKAKIKNGDIFDCIDIYKQPALNHPLLKNHKIQVAAVKPFNDKKTTYYGAGAYINVYNLEVKYKQHTTAQIWIENGPSHQRNNLQVGWMVAPQVVGDNRTRLFSYWTADSSKTGCYNTLCLGFVQVDKTYTVGMELTGKSKYGDPYQHYIPVSISKDRRTGNWWLYWFSTPVGYWPNLIVPSLGRGASLVAWGGATIGIPNGYSPPMGNGHFPGVDFTRKECFIAKLHMYDAYNNIIYPDKNHMDATVDSPKCYGVQYYGYQDKSFEHVIGFGGPGGKC